ncbi:hypothetical protein [Litchfieldella xinjiangensis]|uniref:hypothetical protein n=1 Tax=Litchfieldella xinjiangensis TaxID=1166948 RepID=UPI0005BD9C54|nr:hypothetical protein [Halomonas xinjiangensis]
MSGLVEAAGTAMLSTAKANNRETILTFLNDGTAMLCIGPDEKDVVDVVMQTLVAVLERRQG